MLNRIITFGPARAFFQFLFEIKELASKNTLNATKYFKVEDFLLQLFLQMQKCSKLASSSIFRQKHPGNRIWLKLIITKSSNK